MKPLKSAFRTNLQNVRNHQRATTMFSAWVNYLIKKKKKKKKKKERRKKERKKKRTTFHNMFPKIRLIPQSVRKFDLAYNFVNKYEIIHAKRTYNDF